MSHLAVACIQMRSTTDVAENAALACALIVKAVGRGAKLVATPEMTTLIDRRPGAAWAAARAEAEDSSLPQFRALAAKLGVWLLIGSMPIRPDDGDGGAALPKCANRSFLISPSGEIAARYDKIHRFDVDLGGAQDATGGRYRESDSYIAGDRAVVAAAAGTVLGLSVCYDLRFPQLYRALAKAGASILAVPSAFTAVTGAAHWHILLRARAIETGSFVIAPAQGGRHADGRETYGHTLIVAPWGEIVAEIDGQEPGVLLAELDLSAVADARGRIPALAHDRDFLPPGA